GGLEGGAAGSEAFLGADDESRRGDHRGHPAKRLAAVEEPCRVVAERPGDVADRTPPAPAVGQVAVLECPADERLGDHPADVPSLVVADLAARLVAGPARRAHHPPAGYPGLAPG